MVVCGDVRLPAEMVLETPDRGWRPLHDDGDTRWVADDAFLFGPSIRGQSASDFGLRSSAQLDGISHPRPVTPRHPALPIGAFVRNTTERRES